MVRGSDGLRWGACSGARFGRRRPRAAAAALAALLVAACGGHRSQSVSISPARSDSIILVTIDTWRADAAGFAGNSRVKTPFLDSIASRGIVFTNAHAHNVVTLPSHVNILTGLLPYQHGVRDNAGFVLAAKYETVASRLRSRGYATGAFVAAFPLDSRFGLNRGFDVYDDNYGKGPATLDFALQERSASAVLEAASKWWRSVEGRKRFLWIHLYDPHAPYRPPEPFAAQYANDPYLGEVASVDDALAKNLGPLLTPKTLLIVTGDHGEARGDHGELTHGLFAYEATLKIPLLVAAEGVPHRTETAYVRHSDIVPTILESAGIAKPAELPGASLLHDYGGRDTYFESLSASLNRGWAPLTGVIRGGQKYIDLPIAELYDLPRDHAEKTNLRDERRREVDSARKILAAIRAAEVKSSRSLSAEEAARLRSVGYISGASEGKTSFTAADDPKNLVALDSKMHGIIDAYERGDPAAALKLAREVVAERPSMIAGRELLAFVLQENERVPEAIEVLRSMVRDERSQDYKVRLGLLLSETGKTEEAVRLLEPLGNSRNPDALNALGIALADVGKADDAARHFERALEIDPNNAPALQNLGIVALRREDVQSALTYLIRALALNPRLPLALNTLGVVYARMNDLPRAVDAWNRAVAIDPRQYDALFNIGLVEVRAGHVAEARQALTRFVETAPTQRYATDIATARQALAQLR